MRILPLLAILGTVFAQPAIADECQPEFVSNTETVTVSNLEVGVGKTSREDFQIRVRNGGSGPCSAKIRFTRLGVPAGDASPNYALISGSFTLDIVPDGSAPTVDSELLVPNAPNGPQGRAIPFQITIPSEWGLRAGLYSEQIGLKLFDSSGTEVDSLILTINIAVPQAVSLRIVGATGADDIARLNLGVLSSERSTTSNPFAVRVWSTSGYLVSFFSANSGQLVDGPNLDKIPYQLRFDQQNVNLAGGDQFIVPAYTSSLGRIHPLLVQVAPVVARAGEYSDRVTVTVTAM